MTQLGLEPKCKTIVKLQSAIFRTYSYDPPKCTAKRAEHQGANIDHHANKPNRLTFTWRHSNLKNKNALRSEVATRQSEQVIVA